MHTRNRPARGVVPSVGALALASLSIGCGRHGSSSSVAADQAPTASSTSAKDPSMSDSTGHSARAIIQAAWDALPAKERGVFYGLAISPAMPSEWPAANGGTLSFRTYGFAYGQDVRQPITDGQYVSAAWMVVTGPGNGGLLIERAPFVKLGVQGVTPVAAGSFATDAERDAAALELAGNPASPSALVQKVYCVFRQYNGTFMQSVDPRHASFYAWLKCPTAASKL